MNEPSDAECELFEQRCRAVLGDVNNHIWTKKDGTKIHVSKMETDHILNCLKMLERNGYGRHDFIFTNDLNMGEAAADAIDAANLRAMEHPYSPWFRIFEKELRIRNVKI